MKSILTASVMVLASCLPAGAMDINAPVTRQLYTCAKPGLSRVAMTTNPAPCCDGQLKCAQFLSTEALTRKRALPRT